MALRFALAQAETQIQAEWEDAGTTFHERHAVMYDYDEYCAMVAFHFRLVRQCPICGWHPTD